MIAMKELLGGRPLNDLSIKQQQNLSELCKRLNVLRAAYGRPMIITSGFRTEQDHRRIYSAKGITGDDVPMGSRHLQGLAADIADNGTLRHWLKNDPKAITLLEELELYCEEGTTSWTHIQIGAPKSGNRWFLP